eukprot:504969-Heterocapsa_arctica.AAC.1
MCIYAPGFADLVYAQNNVGLRGSAYSNYGSSAIACGKRSSVRRTGDNSKSNARGCVQDRQAPRREEGERGKGGKG